MKPEAQKIKNLTAEINEMKKRKKSATPKEAHEIAGKIRELQARVAKIYNNTNWDK